MPRFLPLLALGAALGMAALPAAAAPVLGAAPETRAAPAVLLAQYYAPPPPRPRYRRPPPRRHCWTQTQRVVQYDRWGRPHVRFVPRTVCGYRR
jgi:hypothetical protein